MLKKVSESQLESFRFLCTVLFEWIVLLFIISLFYLSTDIVMIIALGILMPIIRTSEFCKRYLNMKISTYIFASLYTLDIFFVIGYSIYNLIVYYTSSNESEYENTIYTEITLFAILLFSIINLILYIPYIIMVIIKRRQVVNIS